VLNGCWLGEGRKDLVIRREEQGSSDKPDVKCSMLVAVADVASILEGWAVRIQALESAVYRYVHNGPSLDQPSMPDLLEGEEAE
jgi:hypothetical protein